MKGYRNLVIVLVTILVQGYLVYVAITTRTNMAALSPVLIAIASTAVGGAFARGYSKKVAPDQ